MTAPARILVIGGYGGFGARLSRRLAAAGHRVLVAGRRKERAEAFCAGMAGAEPVLMDRNGDVEAMLIALAPDLVIDAAGPFQASRFEVPLACISAAIPYLDIADARAFVMGVAALGEVAGPISVPVISGASSVPALSGAVVRKLAAGLDEVRAVELAISASNRSSAGASVVAALLSYVGRPVRLWRGGRWATAHGWQEMRQEDFLLEDGSGLEERLVAIADVADHDIIPELFPGRPSVTFRAGNELGWQMRMLWLLSWPVRWGWLRSLRPLGRVLLPLYRATLGLGGDRSAMSVSVKGLIDGRGVERRWTLVADEGDGPEIPVMAAELLADDILKQRARPGPRHAGSELALARFESPFASLAIRHETRERSLTPLYARVLGARFAELPRQVRSIHEVCGDAGAGGQGRVVRGRGLWARAIGAMMRFPPAGAWPLHVRFAERGGIETWTRDFGGHRFSSSLSEAGGILVERFGPIRLGFELTANAGGLEMLLRRWSAFGITLPLWLAPRIAAREWQEGERFRFEVAVSMLLIGRIVAYSGWLIPLDRRPMSEPEAAPMRSLAGRA